MGSVARPLWLPGGRAAELNSGRLGTDTSPCSVSQPPEDVRAGGDGAALRVRGLPWSARGPGAPGEQEWGVVPCCAWPMAGAHLMLSV